MAGLNGESTKIIAYDATEIDFVSPVKDALGLGPTGKLSRLHEGLENSAVVTRENDSTSDIHRRYYENVGSTNFYDVYKEFLHRVVAELIEEPLIVQKVPSFRVHLPGNKAVGEYHRDRDFGHQEGAINFWVPVTDAHDTNTMHIKLKETDEPAPVEVKLGEVLAFDAVNFLHGNEINQTNNTRVSFDFRVIPESKYVDSREKSINTMTTLALGGYYVHAEDL